VNDSAKYWRRSLGIGFLLAASALLLPACKAKNSPSTPTAPTPTPSGPYIIAQVAVNGSISLANVFVSDSTGTTGTANTSVSLTTNSASEAMTTLGSLVNSGGLTIDGVPYLTGSLYSGAVTYNAGQVYQFNVNIGGTTYSAAATGFSGSPVVSPSSGSGGVTCSWAAGVGNKDYIHIVGLPTPVYIGPPIPSNPYTISNSVFSNETPGAGNDSVNLQVDQVTTGAFPGAQNSSCVIVRDVAGTAY